MSDSSDSCAAACSNLAVAARNAEYLLITEENDHPRVLLGMPVPQKKASNQSPLRASPFLLTLLIFTYSCRLARVSVNTIFDFLNFPHGFNAPVTVFDIPTS